MPLQLRYPRKINMVQRKSSAKARPVLILILAGVAGGGIFYLSHYFSAGKTLLDLVRENKELKQAVANLTHETQIGYAKVISQQTREGRLYTRLKFVETDPADPLKRLLEKEYEIEGDVVHFDALIVTFEPQLVMDGRERSLYLWRRIYGETMTPEQGLPIETPGDEPKRYAALCEKLSIKDRTLFWREIWQLSNDPAALQHIGVRAIYGNVVYRKLKPGLIYIFKISPTGVVTPEIIPDL
jgi:hypothetical protein